MPVKRKTATKKKSVKRKSTKSKSAFLDMSYGKADAFCTRAGRELKKKRTSSAGRRLRRCK